MKKIISIFILALLISPTLVQSQQSTLNVTIKFSGIIEGYDHETKTKVFIDGEEAGGSSVLPESEGNKFSVSVPMGTHDLIIMNYAKYEGAWEEHTIENNYSLDAFYKNPEFNFSKKKHTVSLVFDIETESTEVKKAK